MATFEMRVVNGDWIVWGSTGSTLPLLLVHETKSWREAWAIGTVVGRSRPDPAAATNTKTPSPEIRSSSQIVLGTLERIKNPVNFNMRPRSNRRTPSEATEQR